MRTLRHRALASLLALAQPALVALAYADKATGLSLYDEADRLARAGQWPAACAAFAASEKELPRPVTLLRLADCYEHAGRTATAWATFRDAVLAARAAQSNAEFDAEKEKRREAEAARRRDEIEKKLTRVRLVVSKPVAGLVVRRAQDEVPKAAWGTALAVDPGTLTVEASAPGYVTWRGSVDAVGEGKTIDVEIPELAREVAAPPPPAAPTTAATTTATPPSSAPTPAPNVATDRDRPTSGRRTSGLVLGGTGIVGLGVGAALWASARSKANGAACDASYSCATQADIDARASARTTAMVGNVVFGVGAALAVGGVVLWLTAPSASTGAVVTKVGIGPSGVVIGGVF
jgi:serine/threonine-protein kinase